MNIDRIAIICAGGHAKVVIDALRSSDPEAHIVVYDDDHLKKGHNICGVEVICPIADIDQMPDKIHVATGNNDIRKFFGMKIIDHKKSFLTILHGQAIVSQYAQIGSGVFIAAGSIIGPNSIIGNGAIINHSAVVDHDCLIGAWTHVAPNATLGGGVRVGEGCLIGSGAVILPGISVGDHAVVGAGAVVTKDIPDHLKVAGIPARRLSV